MYRGFKLKQIQFEGADYKKKLLEAGNTLFDQNKKSIAENLTSFIISEKSLDGTKIQNTWFPQIDADVFISHSRYDNQTATMLAGWLFNNFKIKSFIDSALWGYSDTLLKVMDDAYCKKEGENTYDYAKRNNTTSHIHMMLSSALMAMIDKAECLIFLNTKNSIKLIEGIANTESPWLYLEIGISQIIQKKIPERFLLEHEELSSKRQLFEKAQSIKYEVDLNHLTEIDHNTLNQWSVSKYLNSPQDALDALYTISPAKQYSDSLHGS